MSSHTGRGKARVPFDFYPTPPWCVDRLLDRHGYELLWADMRALEPTVGDGAIVRAVDAWTAREGIVGRSEWTGVELRRGALLDGTELDCHIEGVDFRSWHPWDEPFDLSLGNPPFSIAESIIRHAMEFSRVVVMLLRVDFLGSADRVPFWAGPGADPCIRVLPDRPSFDGDGTDSSTYAWFVWGVELSGPRVDVLDTTHRDVRAAQKPAPPTGIPQLGLGLDVAENWREPQDCD